MLQFKRLFIPQHWKGKRLLSQKRMGISIEQDGIKTALLTFGRKQINVDALEHYDYPAGVEVNQATPALLANIAAQIPSKTEIQVFFPAEKVITKTVTVPLLDEQKIRLIIDYEVEASIPFPIEEAIIDFVILSQSEVKQTSTLLVVAARSEEVKAHLDLFIKAGIEPSCMGVNIGALVDFQHAFMPSSSHPSLLIEYTRQAIQLGIVSPQKNITFTRYIRFAKQQTITLEQSASLITQEVTKTIKAYELRNQSTLALSHISVVGGEKTALKPLYDALEKVFEVPILPFITKEVFEKLPLQSKQVLLSEKTIVTHLYAITAACMQEYRPAFNLRQKHLALSPVPDLQKNLLVSILLMCSLLGIFAGYAYYDTTTISRLTGQKEKREIRKLERLIPPLKKKRLQSLAPLVKHAQTYVKEQEELWAPFSKERVKTLEILQELTLLINRKKYDVSIDRVIITSDEQSPFPIEVQGSFRSPTGSEHFKYFDELVKDIKNAHHLGLAQEPDPTRSENGITFIMYFKPLKEG